MLCSRFLKPKEQKNEVKPEQAEKNDSEATESKEKDEKQNNAGGEMQVQDLTTETVKDTTDDTASSETLEKEDTEIECEANVSVDLYVLLLDFMKLLWIIESGESITEWR